MNPKPLSSLNHLTVPVAIVLSSGVDSAANAEIAKQRLRALALPMLGKPPNLVQQREQYRGGAVRSRGSGPELAGPSPGSAVLGDPPCGTRTRASERHAREPPRVRRLSV